MPKDPWTDPDPQPGDFDEFVSTMDPRDIQVHEGNPSSKLTIVVNVQGEDASLLQRIATEREQGMDEVISDLVRGVKPHAGV
jgi:hypothetical protein